MLLNYRLLRETLALFAIAALAMMAATPAHAQPGRGTVIVDSPLFNVPQFAVEALRFKALDETGWDFTGSDEIYAVFSDMDPTHSDRITAVYGNVDAGDIVNFSANDSCMAPQPTCQRGMRRLYVVFSFWEHDHHRYMNFCPGGFGNDHKILREGICPHHDFVGWGSFTLSEQQLVAALPTVGMSVENTVRLAGGSGSYDFTYRITRRPNGEGQIVVGEGRDPVAAPITLTASPVTGGDRGVRLVWSGAAGNRVDIYRNGALLINVENTGSYIDRPAPGAYQYRVCNAGTNVCSVTVTGVST